MPKNQKDQRKATISFTKINDDVIVPTRLIESQKSREHFVRHPVKSQPYVWWCLAGLWSLLIFVNHFDSFGLVFATSAVFIIGIGWHLLDYMQTYWLEFNRTDGYVCCWASPKKKKLFRREHIDNLFFQADRSWHTTSARLGRGEYRFYINLYYRKAVEKKKAFCTVFELFSDDKTFADPDWEDYFLSGALAHSVDAFIRDFMKGKPLPISATEHVHLRAGKLIPVTRPFPVSPSFPCFLHRSKLPSRCRKSRGALLIHR